jgi:hypothetical protein
MTKEREQAWEEMIKKVEKGEVSADELQKFVNAGLNTKLLQK